MTVKTDLKITTNHVIAGAVILVGGVVFYKSAKVAKKLATETLNPANSKNVVNTAVINAVGEQRVASVADRIFGAIDLINPFNRSDEYAKQVYGIGQKNEESADQKTINGTSKEGIGE